MINLRYHIVSLTAVFLALAIGVVMGTTFLNKQAVDQLNRQVKKAESGIETTRDQNADLRRELAHRDAADDALEADGARLFDNELTDARVLVIASEDIDGESLDRVRTSLDQAGADLRGTLRITDRLRADAGDEAELAALLGATATDRATLQQDLVDQVGTALRAAAARAPGSDATAPELVQDLIDGKYLNFESPDETIDATSVLAGGGYRFVVVSGVEPRTPDVDFLVPVLRAATVDGPQPIVVGSAATGDDPESTRTAVVGPIRDDGDLRGDVSTVDHLEGFAGLAATVYAVSDFDDDVHGHYGYGDGADAVLPEAS